MLRLVFEALFYALPIFVANSCATLTLSIPLIKDRRTPIDFGQSWRGKRILGDGKSFQGLFFGTFMSAVVGVFQYGIFKNWTFEHVKYLNESSLVRVVILALFLGFGALFGDIVKSFFKRRIGITRGNPWVPFDQLDFLIGGVIFGSLVYFPGWEVILTLAIITPLGHFLSNICAYYLGLKDVWW